MSRPTHVAAATAACASMLLLGACSGTPAASGEPEQASVPLWSMLNSATDYKIADNVDELIAGTDAEHMIRGVVVDAEPGVEYSFGEGDSFESAFLTVDVSGSDIPGINTAVVEVEKPGSVSASALASAAYGDGEVVFVVKAQPLFDVQTVTDLDERPNPETVYAVASIVQGALAFEGDSVVSLTTGDKVLTETESSSVNQLGDEFAEALP